MKYLIMKFPLSGNTEFLVYEYDDWCNCFLLRENDRIFIGSESKKCILKQLEENSEFDGKLCSDVIVKFDDTQAAIINGESSQPDQLEFVIYFQAIDKKIVYYCECSPFFALRKIWNSCRITAFFKKMGMLFSNMAREKKICETERRRFAELLNAALSEGKSAMIGLELDADGWAYVPALIQSMKKSGQLANMRMLESAVSDSKQYFFNEDMSKIRAINREQ